MTTPSPDTAFEAALSLAGFHDPTWVGDRGDLRALFDATRVVKGEPGRYTQGYDAAMGVMLPKVNALLDEKSALVAEIAQLKAQLAIAYPPLPVPMADCGVYCKTAIAMSAEIAQLREENAALKKALPFTAAEIVRMNEAHRAAIDQEQGT